MCGCLPTKKTTGKNREKTFNSEDFTIFFSQPTICQSMKSFGEWFLTLRSKFFVELMLLFFLTLELSPLNVCLNDDYKISVVCSFRTKAVTCIAIEKIFCLAPVFSLLKFIFLSKIMCYDKKEREILKFFCKKNLKFRCLCDEKDLHELIDFIF